MTTKYLQKGSLLSAAKVIISLGVLWFLIKSAQINLVLFKTLLCQPLYFFCVVLVFLFMVVIGSWRWYILNSSSGIHLSFVSTWVATYLGSAFNNILPGAIGGDVVRLYYVFKKVPQKKNNALLSVFLDRLLGFFAVFIAMCFVAVCRLNFFSQQPELIYLLSICITFCLGVFLAFLALFGLLQHIGFKTWLSKCFASNRLTRKLISFLDTMSLYRINMLAMLKCVIISIGLQVLIAATVLVIAAMMGLPKVSFSDYVIAMGIAQIVNLIPITPGGIGIGEMAFANVLQLLNPGIIGAFATIFFAYRLISMLAYFPGMIWCLPRFVFMKQSKLQVDSL